MKDLQLASSLRSAISKMNKRLRKQTSSSYSFSISEFTTMSYLNITGSYSPSELADLLKVKGQSMSEIISRLQQRDMVKKIPSLTDKRKALISLTEHGKQFVAQTRYERDEWLNSAIEMLLTAKEKQVLKEAAAIMDKLSDFV